MSEAAERGSGSGTTDFGRALATQPTHSLAEAVREHARRKHADEARRYRLTMGLIGYLAGLAVVVPAVVWLASEPVLLRLPFGAATADGARPPKLISAPLLTSRESAVPAPAAWVAPAPATTSPVTTAPATTIAVAPAPPAPAEADPRGPLIETARALVDQGRLLEARRALTDPRLERVADAQFLLAETYDPNVLAALGATGVQPDVAAAERFYRAARELGSPLAIQRLRALD